MPRNGAKYKKHRVAKSLCVLATLSGFA